jgi:hypothetical protein
LFKSDSHVAAGYGLTVGGILLGAAKPAHILTPSSTVRRIVHMTAGRPWMQIRVERQAGRSLRLGQLIPGD